MNFVKRKYSFISILILQLLSGCTDRQEQWFENYAQVKCAYQHEENALYADSVKNISSLVMEKDKLSVEIDNLSKPFNEKIEALNVEIKNEQKKYMKEYRKLTDKHNEKYGHVSTPAYENALLKIQQSRDERILVLQNKIKAITDELTANSEFQKISNMINQFEGKISEQKSIIQSKHQPAIDSLQVAINNLNSNYKRIISDLSGNEKNDFEARRDSIRKNPCKYVSE